MDAADRLDLVTPLLLWKSRVALPFEKPYVGIVADDDVQIAER